MYPSGCEIPHTLTHSPQKTGIVPKTRYRLLGLVLSSLEDEIFMKNNVRFQVIGEIERLPKAVQEKLRETMEHTAANDTMTMVVALSYSSRWKSPVPRGIATEVKTKGLDLRTTEEMIGQHLTTSFILTPTSHPLRAARTPFPNYLLWQIALFGVVFLRHLLAFR